jgi:hypothetical protein
MGQIPWYGQRHMLRKFENTYMSTINFKIKADNSLTKAKEDLKRAQNDPEQLEDWIMANQSSMWGIKSDEAHDRIVQSYTKSDIDYDKLVFLQDNKKEGNVENPLMAQRM